MQELWLPVSGYEGFYEVSSCGRVRSLDRTIIRSDGRPRRFNGKLLKPRVRTLGRQTPYLIHTVNLSMQSKHKNAPIHKLVAKAFIPNPDRLPVIRHLDNNSTNNQVANLAWGTHKQNTQDAVAAGRTASGARHGSSKLSQEDVDNIRKLRAQGITTVQIAKLYNISRSHVSGICLGTYWQN